MDIGITSRYTLHKGLMYNEKFAYVCYNCGSYNELPDNEQEIVEKFRNDMGLTVEQHGKMRAKYQERRRDLKRKSKCQKCEEPLRITITLLRVKQ